MRCPHCNKVLKVKITIDKGDELEVLLEELKDFNIKQKELYLKIKNQGTRLH